MSGCGAVEKPRTVIQSVSEESLTGRYSSFDIMLISLTLIRMALFQHPTVPTSTPFLTSLGKKLFQQPANHFPGTQVN
jgi:hypothetical protein